MTKRDNIETLFKSALEHHEADVNPALWQRIEAGLPSMPASVTPGTSLLSKITATGWITSGLTVGAIAVITGLLINSQGTEETPASKANENAVKTEQTIAPENNTPLQPEVVITQSVSEVFDQNQTTKTRVKEQATEVSVINNNAIGTINEAFEKNNNLTANDKNQQAITQTEPSANANAVQSNTVQNTNQAMQPEPVKEESNLQAVEPGNQSSTANYNLGQIPNVFTPNGDGINDLFMIKPVDIKSFTVVIFDRSGKIMHEWSNPFGFWDGLTKNGEKAPDGVYFYSIVGETNDNQTIKKKGSITIKR